MKQKKHSITKAGLEALKSEQEALLNKRIDAVTRLDTARRQGDLSENSEYHAAKEALSWVDRRLAELEILIKTASVVSDSTNGQIGLGTTVTIESNGQNLTYTLVGEYEADISAQKISSVSPLGAALLGKKIGDLAQIKTPGGEKTYKIISLT